MATLLLLTVAGCAEPGDADWFRAAVRDAAAHLKELPRLQGLSLWKGFITDAGCRHLGRMSGLIHLSLDETRVTARRLPSRLLRRLGASDPFYHRRRNPPTPGPPHRRPTAGRLLMYDPCEANPDPTELETTLTLLYDRLRPALRTIANHWIRRCGIGDRVAPDDLLGTAMLAVLRKPMEIKQLELTEMAAYLSSTLKYQAFMILRKKQAERRALRTKTARLRQAMVCSQEADPAATLRRNDCLETIYEQLSGEERMLGMFRRAGYQWSEIAAQMNSSPARLQKRFERAIRRTKRLLDP